MALTENLQRQNLTPFEEAWGILKLIKDYQMTIAEAAKELCKNPSYIRKRLKLLSLPKEIQAMIGKEQLSMSHIELLASLGSREEQEEVANIAAKEHLTPAELKKVVAERLNTNKKMDPRKLSALKIAIRILAHKDFLRSVLSHVKEMERHEKDEVQGSLKELAAEINYFLREI